MFTSLLCVENSLFVKTVKSNTANRPKKSRRGKQTISLKLDIGLDFDHVTVDTLQTFKVKGSEVKVTA